MLFLLFTASLSAATPPDVMTYQNVSGALQTGVPMQFGRVFVQGEIANYPQVSVNNVPVAVLRRNVEAGSAFSDGSVKHAIISFVLASVPSNTTYSFTFSNQASCSCGPGAQLTQAAMLGSNFDFDAQIVAAGATASARAQLMNWDGITTSAAVVRYWADGSIATTIILADHTSSAAYDISVNGFNSLRPVFICTFWPTLNKVKVRFVLENSNTTTLQDLAYSVTLTTGNASPGTVYTNSAVPHVAATRWTKSFWDRRYAG